jgi:hypothetical protein
MSVGGTALKWQTQLGHLNISTTIETEVIAYRGLWCFIKDSDRQVNHNDDDDDDDDSDIHNVYKN